MLPTEVGEVMTMDDVIAGRSDCALTLGDTRKVLAATPDDSLDLVVTDPPFGIKHDSNREGSEWAKQIEGDDAVDVSWLGDLARAVKHSPDSIGGFGPQTNAPPMAHARRLP